MRNDFKNLPTAQRILWVGMLVVTTIQLAYFAAIYFTH
jgi:hypothetical protein